MERRRRLRDLLAAAAGELLAHRLDHLPLARNDLQRLGYVLADLRQLVRAAARAGGRRGHHHPFARKMFGERLARRSAAGERLDLRRSGCRQLVLGRACLKLVELEFQLVEKPLLALRTLAVELVPELLDRQLQGGDLCLGVRDHRRRVRGLRLGRHCLGLGLRRLGFGIHPPAPRHPRP